MGDDVGLEMVSGCSMVCIDIVTEFYVSSLGCVVQIVSGCVSVVKNLLWGLV